jgi:NADH dehydrogenase/NADH:ubiquinone oxidoreductase subunit G
MGMATMGVASRGYTSEIFDYNYVNPTKSNKTNSILISNIVDICPVGWTAL